MSTISSVSATTNSTALHAAYPEYKTVTGNVTDTAQLREMIGVTKATLGTIGEQFRILQDQQAKVAALAPSMEHASSQIDQLRRHIRKHDKRQHARMQDIKELIREQLKDQAERQLRPHIHEEIRREMVAQVRAQVREQLKEHVSVSLEEQAAESKRQLVEVKHALRNSEARRTNALLRTDNVHDQLAVVLKPDGTRSDVYPHNLHSLFAYSDDILHTLLRDHDLTIQDQREKNMNRFMAHIGVGFRLVPIPDQPGQNEAENESVV